LLGRQLLAPQLWCVVENMPQTWSTRGGARRRAALAPSWRSAWRRGGGVFV